MISKKIGPPFKDIHQFFLKSIADAGFKLVELNGNVKIEKNQKLQFVRFNKKTNYDKMWHDNKER